MWRVKPAGRVWQENGKKTDQVRRTEVSAKFRYDGGSRELLRGTMTISRAVFSLAVFSLARTSWNLGHLHLHVQLLESRRQGVHGPLFAVDKIGRKISDRRMNMSR